MDGQVKDSIRFQTMPIDKIDAEELGSMICKEWREGNEGRDEYFAKREDFTANWLKL
jgi:hypothetical protein